MAVSSISPPETLPARLRSFIEPALLSLVRNNTGSLAAFKSFTMRQRYHTKSTSGARAASNSVCTCVSAGDSTTSRNVTFCARE